MKRTNVFINTKDCSLRGFPTTYSITVSDQFYYEHYYGSHAMLSIGDVLPLHGILEGTVICNVKHHIGDHGVFARASEDYAIVISHNLDNGTSRRGSSWMGMLPAEVWPPWLEDVSSNSMN